MATTDEIENKERAELEALRARVAALEAERALAASSMSRTSTQAMTAHRLADTDGRVTVSFLIPAFNEAATIAEVLARLDALGLDRQIVVVDDGSRDDTAAIAERYAAESDGIVVLRKPNGGKGSALRHGIPHLTGEIVVIQDA